MKFSVQPTDIRVTTLSGSTWNEEPKKSGKGCWVGVGAAIAIVFAAAVAATIVGLLVFYLHPDRKTSEDVTTTTTTATTTECIDCTTTAPPVDYRLPGDLVPYFYDARLRPNFYEGDIPKESYTNGSVSILFGVKSETKDIVLHSKTLAVFVDSITVEDDQGRNLSPKSTSYDKKREFFTIKMTEALQTGSNYTVSMQFNCSLKADLTGIYLSTYQDANNQPVYIVTSQAQATEARKMFPCFDEPAIKAVFNITLERKTNWKSFSNTEIDQTYNISDDWVADKYLPTPQMSTYLLAVVISQFECVDNMAANGRVKVSICSRKEYLNQTEFANSVAAEMQDYYVNYYNICYPLPKMAHMAVPDFSAGAMENWGLILYRETALLYDDASSSAYYRQRVAIVVAHELAHQWFGNLVTPQWWDDIWLNEGFASYMEITCTDNSFPNWDMEGQFVVDDLQSVLTTDSLVSSHPIYQEVNDPAQINELFDSIAYSKGASIIRMMRYFLGDEIFRWGISDYLKNRSYTAAHHLDLFRALTESAQNRGKPDINVTEIMQTWILQLGYPVIHVMYHNSSGSISLKQEHFLLNRNETPPASPYGYKWIVPISIVTSVSGDFNNARQGWLNSTEGTIQADTNADWIIVNSMQQYYYRVNYDAMAWNALISQLMQNHTVIHSNNRAQLIDDSFNLGRAGYIDVERFLEITKYLNKEEAYVPWRATWKDMAFLKRMFELSGSYEYLKKYVQQQVEPIYVSIGWSTPGTDNHLRERHQGIVLDMACSYGNEDCLKEAAKQFMSWMENSTSGNPIDPNVRAVAYCSGIETGGSAEWQFAWQRFLDAPSSSEATTLLQSLACTKDIYLLSGYLDKALALDGIRLQDFQTVLTSVSRNPAGRSMAWDFVRQNWNQLLEWFRDSAFTLPNIVRDVTQSFSTEWELKELEYFRDNTEDFATATRAVEQAIENTKSNIEWRQRNEQKVAVWLKNNTKSI